MNKLSELEKATRRIEALSEDYHKQLDAKNREIERLKKALNDLTISHESLQRYCNDLQAINRRVSDKREKR